MEASPPPQDAGMEAAPPPQDAGMEAAPPPQDAGQDTGSPPPAYPVIAASGGSYPGTTAGTSQVTGTCASQTNSAPEKVFQYQPTTSGMATFSTCSPMGTFDTVLYLRNAIGSGSELACNDDTNGCGVADGAPNASRHGSRITVNVTAGQTYYVVVDGFAGSPGGSAGNFVLTVVSPP
jgi:hypothetical protein